MNFQTELKLHQAVPGGYVDWNIDLDDNTQIPISKSITDIQNIADRKSDYTLTIKLPGTANNNKIFSEIFNLARSVISTDQNYYPDFNPTLKASATVYKNGIVQISGYLQLTNIVVTDEQEIEYNVIIIGGTANLFQDIAQLKMDALDLSQYDHDYTRINIVNSWTAPVGEGYVYGFIDYGFASDETNYYVDYMLPQIYIKTIVDAIFAAAGYRYESNFFNSERFKRLVFPFAGKQFVHSANEVTDRTFELNRIVDSSVIIDRFFVIPVNNLAKDTLPPGANPSTYGFTVPPGGNGNYTFACNLKTTITTTGISPTGTLMIRKNGIQKGLILLFNVRPIGTFDIDKTLIVEDIYCEDGDVIDCVMIIGNGFFSLSITILAGTSFYNQPNPAITENSLVILSDTLPSDINQTDFLSSLFKLFNLYIDNDKLDKKKLIIEPRDDFYLDTAVDLTPYVDVASGVNIMPMGALQYKSYNYAYQPDDDWTNSSHQNKFVDTYGIRKFNIINDFVVDDYQTAPIFSPTPLRDKPTNSPPHNRVLTYIKFWQEGVFTQSPAHPRILYRGGDISCTTWYLLSREVGSSPAPFNAFPYVGHLDSVSNPQFDLCFGVPTEVQYNAPAYTDNNLFNIYHKKGLLEIIDPDSKIVEYKMRLNEVQQNQLSFRNFYFIDKQYYRLYNIDYDANSEDLTTIKFLKLKNAPAFIGEQVAINGGRGSFTNSEPLPTYNLNLQRNNNVYSKGGDIIPYGNNNRIQADGAIINSDNNFVSGKNVTLHAGSGNQVLHNDVTLIGTNDFTTYRDGMTVINNIVQPDLFKTTLTAYDVSAIASTPLQLLPKFDGYLTELVNAYATIYFDVIPVVYNESDIQLTYEDGTNIISFTNAISTSEATRRERGVLTDSVAQQSAAINITGSDNMGDAGTGKIIIEVYYKLIPLITSVSIPDPPVNTVAPLISGTNLVGQTLTSTDGTWTGTEPITYTYQWKRNGVDIVGATNNTYLVVMGDLATTLTCNVTATNAAGSSSQISNGITIVSP